MNAILLNDQQECRLNKINKIKDYFVAEIQERELMSKSLSKYIASFYYFHKTLIVLSVITGSICIGFLFATVIEVPVGIVSASFNLAFFIFFNFLGIVKKLLKTARNKNGKT